MPKRKSFLYSAKLSSSQNNQAYDLIGKIRAHQKIGEAGVQTAQETEYTLGQTRIVPKIKLQNICTDVYTDTKITQDLIKEAIFNDVVESTMGIIQKDVVDDHTLKLQLKLDPEDDNSPKADLTISQDKGIHYEIHAKESDGSVSLCDCEVVLAKFVIIAERSFHLENDKVVYWSPFNIDFIAPDLEPLIQELKSEVKLIREGIHRKS